ncbi:nucleotidyl transferase AbiEii/AbiGii toxin family protein, partial [Arthrospira platensis SPKY1]|nr:nucleotidyl transferase AbiEii/AbiGii toxin family protein [Arthrospira platensis SPKY1]
MMADVILESFVLVGGTALSLQLGHRKSIDLDLFSLIDFNSSEILSHLEEKNNNPVVIQQFKQTLTVEIE